MLPHTPMHGLHGIVIGPDGALHASSLTGRAIHRIEPRSGSLREDVAPPDGSSDDLAFGPDGTLAWTGGADGQTLRARRPDGSTLSLATRTFGLNAVRFAPDGRLFFTRVFGGDGLYEADLAHPGTVRTVREGLGGLNAFDFTPDGTIVGPLFMKGMVAAVSPVDGSSRVLASGYDAPCAVRRAAGTARCYVLEYRSGALSRLDAASGTAHAGRDAARARRQLRAARRRSRLRHLDRLERRHRGGPARRPPRAASAGAASARPASSPSSHTRGPRHPARRGTSGARAGSIPEHARPRCCRSASPARRRSRWSGSATSGCC
jgi:streptogramin lyase